MPTNTLPPTLDVLPIPLASPSGPQPTTGTETSDNGGFRDALSTSLTDNRDRTEARTPEADPHERPTAETHSAPSSAEPASRTPSAQTSQTDSPERNEVPSGQEQQAGPQVEKESKPDVSDAQGSTEPNGAESVENEFSAESDVVEGAPPAELIEALAAVETRTGDSGVITEIQAAANNDQSAVNQLNGEGTENLASTGEPSPPTGFVAALATGQQPAASEQNPLAGTAQSVVEQPVPEAVVTPPVANEAKPESNPTTMESLPAGNGVNEGVPETKGVVSPTNSSAPETNPKTTEAALQQATAANTQPEEGSAPAGLGVAREQAATTNVATTTVTQDVETEESVNGQAQTNAATAANSESSDAKSAQPRNDVPRTTSEKNINTAVANQAQQAGNQSEEQAVAAAIKQEAKPTTISQQNGSTAPQASQQPPQQQLTEEGNESESAFQQNDSSGEEAEQTRRPTTSSANGTTTFLSVSENSNSSSTAESAPTLAPTTIGPTQIEANGVGASGVTPQVETVDVNQANFMERVAQAVQTSSGNRNQVTLRLTPPELGAMQVDVIVEKGNLTARFEVQTPAAQRIMTESLSQLKEALSQNSANLERIEVFLADNSADDRGASAGQGFTHENAGDGTQGERFFNGQADVDLAEAELEGRDQTDSTQNAVSTNAAGRRELDVQI